VILGAIDIGSNTVQLLLAQYEKGKIVSRANHIHTTRLGAMDKDNRIATAAIEATVAAIAEFKRLALAAAAARLRILATSAVRDAANQRELVAAIGQIDPPVEILNGREEALLSYKGARSLVNFSHETPVLDVGGASTELIYELASGRIETVSVNVGAVRMMQNDWEVKRVYKMLDVALTARSNADTAVGIGGNITSIAGAAMGLTRFDRDAIEGTMVDRTQLIGFLQQLLPLTIEERCAFSPLLRERGEIIEQGLHIWLTLMDILKLKKILVCGGGILDGAIADMV